MAGDEDNIFDEALNLDPVQAESDIQACASFIKQCAAKLPQPESGPKATETEKETEVKKETEGEKPTVRIRRADFAHLRDHKDRSYDPMQWHKCDERAHPIMTDSKNRLACVGRWQKAEKINPVRVIFIEDEQANAFQPETESDSVEGEMIAPQAEPVRPAGGNSNQIAFLWLTILALILGPDARKDWERRKGELSQAVTDWETATGKRIPLWAWVALAVAFLNDAVTVSGGSDSIKERLVGFFGRKPKPKRKASEPETDPQDPVEVTENDLSPIAPMFGRG